MVKHFYSFIIETESLFIKIDSLSISDSEKNHLKSLAESQIHHSILDSIMSELTHEDKSLFVKHLNTKDHTKMWKFLHEKINDVEEKIKEAAGSVKRELHKDIAETREVRSNKN